MEVQWRKIGLLGKVMGVWISRAFDISKRSLDLGTSWTAAGQLMQSV